MAATESTLLHAAWVAPMNRAPIPDAGVVIDNGTIREVGDFQSLKKNHPDATAVDLGNAVLTPGLVNAHAHLELSLVQSGEPPASFGDWLMRLMSQLKSEPGDGQRAVTRAIAEGVAQSLRFGVTTIGDISSQPALTRPLLRKLALRVVSFGEVRAMAGRRGLLNERLSAAADTNSAGGKLTIGVSPHAPYSVETDGFRECLARSRQLGIPLTTHLAETSDEAKFLESHAGPLRDVWQWLGGWDNAVPTFTGGPIRFAKQLGLLDSAALLAHVNYCDDDELNLLAAGNASVVYCPRTHAYFGHPPHRWREMIARGINVAVGTDSTASSPNLNLLDDVRLLRTLAPDVEPLTLWQMATTHAARALGLGSNLGEIAPGRPADLVAFDVSSDDPLAEVLDSDRLPRAVWINGIWRP